MKVLNKKLLVISSDSNDKVFVEAAKEMGVYVVCCDRYEDWAISPAKLMADEAWNIDYTKTEEIVKKCKECGIDGVIAGYSEDRVFAACKISNALGTPFYATEEQIQLTRNKKQFKELCQKCGVPVPMDFCVRLPLTEEERSQIVYPVIVKPSDNGGRKGISVCVSEEQLDEAINYAKSQSKDGEVVIEEYIFGNELSAVYTIADGEISLSCLNDKYKSEEEDGMSRFCDLVITPSKYYNLYMETIDGGIRKLLNQIGAKNGVANFQLVVDENGIKAFEMGFRVNGNDDFKVIRKNNDIDFLKMLISYSLTGNMGDDLSKDNPCFKQYHCTVCGYLHGGTIGKISIGNLKENPKIDDINILRQEGAQITENGNNGQKAYMVKASADSMEEITELIHEIQKNIEITNTEGENMFLKPFDTARL